MGERVEGVGRGLAMGLAIWLSATGAARAEDPAAARNEAGTGARRTDSVTVITRQEIERRQWRTLADVLRAQPGVHVTQLGGRGQDTLLFFRGNPNGTVLLRMDGIDLSDPSSDPVGSINDPGARTAGQIVPDLLTENVEKIEIVRGPQSARYGSDAIGGVIEIETRRGSGELSPWASFEVGGFGTTQQSAGFAGGDERSGYSFAYTNAHTRGISATPLGLGNHERDGNDNDTLSGRLDFSPTDALSLRFTGRMVDEDIQLDDALLIPLALSVNLQPGLISGSVDRRGLQGERRRLYLGAETRLTLFDERWVQTFGVRYGDHDVRQDESETLPFQTTSIVGGDIVTTDRPLQRFALENRDGRRLSLDWHNDLRITQSHTLVFGGETERESVDVARLDRRDSVLTIVGTPGFIGSPPIQNPQFVQAVLQTQSRERSHESLRNNALFVGDRFAYDDVFGELMVRLHDHDEYGSGLTYRAGLGYLEPTSKVRIFASIGTAFRDPDVSPGAATVQSFTVNSPTGGFAFDVAPQPSVLSGDRTLDRAVSRGIELGVEAPLLDERVKLGATFFASRVRGLQSASTVVIGPGSINVLDFNDSADERTRGVELFGAWRATPWLELSVDYTYTHAELAHVRRTDPFRDTRFAGRRLLADPGDQGGLITPAPSARAFAAVTGEPLPILSPSALAFAALQGIPPQQASLLVPSIVLPLVNPSGSDLPGVPKHELHASFELRPWDGMELGLGFRYVGPRSGTRLGGADRLGGYTLWDVTSSYAIGENLTLFGRLENLFDKDYSDLELTGEPGFVGFVGVRAVF